MIYDRAQKLALLETWQGVMQKSYAQIDAIGEAVQASPESPLYDALWRLGDAYTRAVTLLVDPGGDWLSWHSNENDFGAKGHEAGYPGKMIAVKSLSDLIDVMEQTA